MNLMTLVYVDERLYTNAVRDLGDWTQVNHDFKAYLWRDELYDLLKVICEKTPGVNVFCDQKGTYISNE